MVATAMPAIPTPHVPPARDNLYRWTPTKELYGLAEAWLWTLAQIDADLADDGGSWAYADGTRALALLHVEHAEAELAKRERLRDRPGAPPWPTRWRDRRGELARIKEALDLVPFIERMFPGTAFVRRGRQLACRCMLPGHAGETTPSLLVHPVKQMWFCHGCKRGGDVFHLAMHYLGTDDFGAVVDNLAREAGIAREGVGRG